VSARRVLCVCCVGNRLDTRLHGVPVCATYVVVIGGSWLSLPAHTDSPEPFPFVVLDSRYVLDPNTRMFLVSWVVVLQSVPGVTFVPYLPRFLNGIFRIFSDENLNLQVRANVPASPAFPAAPQPALPGPLGRMRSAVLIITIAFTFWRMCPCPHGSTAVLMSGRPHTYRRQCVRTS
jgi:hypothetical protein